MKTNKDFKTMFITKAKSKFGNKYDYSMVDYKGVHFEIKLKCNDCDYIYYQKAREHLNSKGCPICSQSRKMNKDIFLLKAKKTHGDIYDYSLINNVNSSRDSVKIKCKQHNKVYEVQAYSHLRGNKLECCAKYNYIDNYELKIKEKLGAKINLIKESYKNNNHNPKINYICSKHGLQTQSTKALLKTGCYECYKEDNYWNKEKLVKKLNEIFIGKYNFDDILFENIEDTVSVYCDYCNSYFNRKIKSLLRGVGCDCQKSSRGELAVKFFLDAHKIKYEMQKTFEDCRNPKTNRKMFFDFYLPQYEMIIEYDGEQHFRSFNYKHESKNIKNYKSYNKIMLNETKFRDNYKNYYCKENKIDLLRISYKQFDKINIILQEALINDLMYQCYTDNKADV